MDHVIRPAAAGMVAVAFSAGLIATPAALPALAPSEIQQVLLTAIAADNVAAIANPAAAAAGLFDALERNLDLIGNQLSGGLTDLLQLDLPGAASNFSAAALNMIVIPDNVLVATVGGVSGQEFESYMFQESAWYPFLDWSTTFNTVSSDFAAAVEGVSQGLQYLVEGEIADGVLHLLGGIDGLIALPLLAVIGGTALIGDALLSLVGL